MMGMLFAIPKTPLHDRLAEEGRLDPSDDPEFGTNVIPLRMSREELRDGYVGVLNDLYQPEAFFERLEWLFLEKKVDMGPGRSRYWRKHPVNALKMNSLFLAQAVGLFVRMMHGIPEKHLRREYRRRIFRLLKVRRDPGTILYYTIKCLSHYHAHVMASQMAGGRSPIFNSW
jgi:hypothetical protein